MTAGGASLRFLLGRLLEVAGKAAHDGPGGLLLAFRIGEQGAVLGVGEEADFYEHGRTAGMIHDREFGGVLDAAIAGLEQR